MWPAYLVYVLAGLCPAQASQVRGSFGCMGEKGSRPGGGGHWQGTMEVQV